MTAAIFGLLGVVVGGVLNSVLTYWLELARGNKQVRMAARVAGSEMARESMRIDRAYGTREWSSLAERPLSLGDEWPALRSVLAAGLTSDDFWRIATMEF